MSDKAGIKAFNDTTIAKETLSKLSSPRLVSELVLLIDQTLRQLQPLQPSALDLALLQKWSHKNLKHPRHLGQAQIPLHQLPKTKLKLLKKGKAMEMGILRVTHIQYSDQQFKKSGIAEVANIIAVAAVHNIRYSRIKPVRSATTV